MTEAYEGDWLVRVRAQVMTRDESAEGWVALDGGGLANVMVGKRARRACQLLTNNNGRNGGESSGEESAARPTHAHAPYEYYIYGKRISDQVVVLSCTIKKDFRYNKVMPTFHHWVTDEKRFGLTFQTAADARAFDKGVRIAIEELLDGLGGAWPALHAYQQHNPAPRDDDEENNIFECLNLPSDSRSSSENSTGSRTLQRRGMSESSAQILSAIDLPTMRSRETPSAPSKELLMQGKQSGAHGDDAEKMCLQLDRDADDYSYVQLTAVHEYTYPQLGTGGVIPPDSSNVEPSAPELESGSIKKRGMPCYKPGPPPLPDKKPSKPESTFQARVKCRHCHEWYLESANRAGACEFAPDCFKSCIDAVTCIKCAQCMMYHCMSDAEGEFATHPCACAPPDDACTKRWAGISLLSLLVPCLCCYPLLRCAHAAARSCRIAGGRHAPHHPTHQ